MALCILIEKYAVSPETAVEAENTPSHDMKMTTLLRRVQFSMLHRTGVEAKDSPGVSKSCPKMLPKISSNQKKTQTNNVSSAGEKHKRG